MIGSLSRKPQFRIHSVAEVDLCKYLNQGVFHDLDIDSELDRV